MRNHMAMTRFQKVVLGVAAGLVALRAFVPVQLSVGRYDQPRTDIPTTLLHIFGILIVAAAMFKLLPSFDLKRLWPRFLRPRPLNLGGRLLLWTVAFIGVMEGMILFGSGNTILGLALIAMSIWIGRFTYIAGRMPGVKY